MILKVELNSLWLSWKVYESSYKQLAKEVEGEGFEIVDYIDNKESDTQVLIVVKGFFLYIVTRGSENWRDWVTNFQINLVNHRNGKGKVHEGFYMDALSVEDRIEEAINEYEYMSGILFVGHSQGAAVAEQHSLLHLFTMCITAGTPRSMDSKMVENIPIDYKYIHFVNNNDVVCRVPLNAMGYKHIDAIIKYFDHRDRLITNPSNFYLQRTRIIGKIMAMLQFKFDDFDDHYPDKYYKRGLKNR